MEQAGHQLLDAPLSQEGRDQATLLEGHYHYVIVSPLRRCQETLAYSKITYDGRETWPSFRERIFGTTGYMLFEPQIPESDPTFFGRMSRFEEELAAFVSKIRAQSQGQTKKILLVGHGYFFNAWYRKGCFATPENAKVQRLYDQAAGGI
jgi:broad specificity phosphatase PhoE